MNSKHASKILIAVVIAIWGLLIYKFVGDYSDGDLPEQSLSKATAPKFETKAKEVFQLKDIDQDPFLGTIKKRASSTLISNSKKSAINWPQIVFIGVVENENGKSKAFIVSVNGQQHIFSKGEQFNEVKLIRGSSEKVSLRFKGELKEFTR